MCSGGVCHPGNRRCLPPRPREGPHQPGSPSYYTPQQRERPGGSHPSLRVERRVTGTPPGHHASGWGQSQGHRQCHGTSVLVAQGTPVTYGSSVCSSDQGAGPVSREFIHPFMPLFIQEIFIERLLSARLLEGLGCHWEPDRQKLPRGLTFVRGTHETG